MINNVVLLGRLTREPKYTVNGSTAIARYTLAVDRGFSLDSKTDFIPCVAFGTRADFAAKHLHKGQKIAVTGNIITGSYTNQEGNTVYTMSVAVSSHEFCDKRQEEILSVPQTSAENASSAVFDAQTNLQNQTEADEGGFVTLPEGEHSPFDNLM